MVNPRVQPSFRGGTWAHSSNSGRLLIEPMYYLNPLFIVLI